MLPKKILLFLVFFLFSLCTGLRHCPLDNSSFSNCDEVQTTKFMLDVTVDFDQQSLYGTNTLNMKVLIDNLA